MKQAHAPSGTCYLKHGSRFQTTRVYASRWPPPATPRTTLARNHRRHKGRAHDPCAAPARAASAAAVREHETTSETNQRKKLWGVRGSAQSRGGLGEAPTPPVAVGREDVPGDGRAGGRPNKAGRLSRPMR